ncbi:MAG: response regulator transcription factor [Acidobacteriota bacterium]|nr:response regulator transcription factor [Acidobacteriota bacterium]
MRVLVVEDDPALGEFLKKGLEHEGHEVDWVGDGELALSRAQASCPDLMVLDLSLPKLDGMEVLEQFRARGLGASVLVLTGRNDLDARVRCLDLGADDCLLKPFSFSELTARSRALLRRREHFIDPVLRHGELQMNRVERRVQRGNHAVDLTAKEFALLEYLFLRRGQCVSRSELLEQVWHMPASADTNIVDVYINYLRRKLSAAVVGGKSREDVIETVRGAGYRLGVGLQARPSSPGQRAHVQAVCV